MVKRKKAAVGLHPPDRLKIGGHWYDVGYFAYPESHSEDCGSVDNMALRILVNAGMAEGRIRESLVHEVLEVLFYNMGMDVAAGRGGCLLTIIYGF